MLTVSLLSIPITRCCSCLQSIIFEVCHRNPHELVADLISGSMRQSFSKAASAAVSDQLTTFSELIPSVSAGAREL